MSIETTIVNYLTTLTGGKSVYPQTKKFENNDCITYRRISNRNFKSMNGLGLFRSRFEINVFDTSYGNVKVTSASIISGMDSNKTDFVVCEFLNETEDFDPEAKINKTSLEFFVWYR